MGFGPLKSPLCVAVPEVELMYKQPYIQAKFSVYRTFRLYTYSLPNTCFFNAKCLTQASTLIFITLSLNMLTMYLAQDLYGNFHRDQAKVHQTISIFLALQITYELGYDGGAFFSPDGKRLVFRASRPKTRKEIAKYKVWRRVIISFLQKILTLSRNSSNTILSSQLRWNCLLLMQMAVT